MDRSLSVFKTKIPVALFSSAVIVIAGGLSYLNSLLNPFIWDDVYLVSANLHIRNLSYIPRLFFENVYHQDMIGKFYRPVLMSSFSLDCHLWGPDPFGYHITNILIHLGNALLVYGLIRLIFRRELLAFLTAMLFVLHPVQTEAVTYISGRADPLATFFCLLSLCFFIAYVDFEGYRRRLYFGVSVLFFLFGLFSKESAAILPLILILYEACFRRGELKSKRSAKYAAFFAILLIYGIIRHFVLLDVKDALMAGRFLPLLNRFYLVPPIILTYIRLLLFPAGLHMERSDFLFDRPNYFFDHRVILALSLLVIVTAIVWSARKRRKEVFFGFGWFVLSLASFLNIIPINAFIAEHWLYLPSVGFFLLISSLIIGLFRFDSIRLCIVSLIIVILGMLGALTVRQNYVWRNPVAFYKYTLKFSPKSTRLRINLGTEYFNLGLYKDAERELREALAAEPEGIYVFSDYINLGSSLYWQGKKKEAFEVYDKAIKLNPASPLGYWYMANTFFLDGQVKKAIEFYRKTVELGPSNAYYWLTLGNAYMKEKSFPAAAEAYKKALSAYPSYFEARINLGIAYSKQGLLNEAFAEYRQALKLDPESPQGYYYIGNVCEAIGQTEKAKEFWEEALKKDPTHVGARTRLEKIRRQLIDKQAGM